MARITQIKCDYVKDGRVCGVNVFVHDDPKYNAPNVEHVVETMDAYGNKLYFCCPLHCAAHWTDVARNQAETLARAAATRDTNAHKAVEELESLIPAPPEDMSLN